MIGQRMLRLVDARHDVPVAVHDPFVGILAATGEALGIAGLHVDPVEVEGEVVVHRWEPRAA